MTRNPAIDFIRGILLLLMTMTHLPTVWAMQFYQPFGFISAAEGFVFVSAFLTGRVFVERQEHSGLDAAVRWAWSRAWRLYLAHLALLLIAFTAVAWIAVHYQRPAVLNLLDFFFESPVKALLSGALLLYQPPLLDILPMYVLFFIGTACVMRIASRWGWAPVLAGSMAVWLAAQFGLRALGHEVFGRLTGVDIALRYSGSFDLYAWQLLWVLGLWFGALGYGQARRVLESSRVMLHLALGVSCAMLIWRYRSGIDGFTDPALVSFWIDKWTLSPVRVVNFAALVFVFVGLWHYLPQRLPHLTLRWPRWQAIRHIGSASQWAFYAHIGSVLFLLCLIGDDDQPLGGTDGLTVLLLGYLALFLAATVYHRKRKTARRDLSDCGS
jgi:hypothetical protein